MGKLAAVCRVGMLQRTLSDLQDQKQFEVLYIAPSAREARKWAMEHIHNQAALHGVDKFWTTGAKKGPPTVRDVPKNKLDELKNWKVTPQPFCLDLLPGHLWKAEIWPFLRDTTALCVPFVNRPFESEIPGTVNFTQFCCVLLVTWCYRVLLSCYLRPK